MDLSRGEIARYMRMGSEVPNAELASRMDALLAESKRAFAFKRVIKRVERAGASFFFEQGSKCLAAHLKGCKAAYVVCGTLGPLFDALLRRAAVSSGVDALILQAIGTAAIEKEMDGVEDVIRLQLAAGEALTSRYSPGYGDWPLAAQRDLLSFLEASRAIGVALTDSLLMVPSKSVSAVMGVQKNL